MGGIIQPGTRELRVEALPIAIPEHVEVSIDTLEIGGGIRLEEIPTIAEVTFLDDPATVLATCVAPRGITDEELEEAEGEEGADETASTEPGDDTTTEE